MHFIDILPQILQVFIAFYETGVPPRYFCPKYTLFLRFCSLWRDLFPGTMTFFLLGSIPQGSDYPCVCARGTFGATHGRETLPDATRRVFAPGT